MRKEIIGNILFIVVVLIITTVGLRLINSKKLTLGRKIDRFMGVLLLLSIISFPFLITTWNPLRRLLKVGEFYIPSRDIQFWIEKAPQGNYYYLRARYIKNAEDFGYGICFDAEDVVVGCTIIFNPKDNRIYGGALATSKGWKNRNWVFYCLGEGKIEKGVISTI